MTGTIFYHRVLIRDGTGILGKESVYKVEEVSVLAENDYYIVIEDSRFTSIRKEKCDYDTCLDKKSIGLNAGDKVWGNEISYTLYSYKRKSAEAIRREIEKEINKRFNFFIGTIDLSIITDKEVA